MNQFARKIRSSKKGSYRGKFLSEKNGGMIPWESLLERDFVKLLEFDPYILSYESQPIQIDYVYDNQKRKYFPDFKATTKENEIFLFEVKPLSKIKDKNNIVKFEVGKRFCERQGWNYRVVTEEDIRKGHLIENLDLIRKVRQEKISFGTIRYLYDVIAQYGTNTCKIEELQRLVESEMSAATFYTNIYYMIYHHFIKVDLVNERLNNQTLLEVYREGGE